jgi:hypothetical protein
MAPLVLSLSLIDIKCVSLKEPVGYPMELVKRTSGLIPPFAWSTDVVTLKEST